MESLTDFVSTGQYDLVINCTGLGAGEIVGDKDINPVRGQIYSTPNKWITTMHLIDDSKDYIIPK